MTAGTHGEGRWGRLADQRAAGLLSGAGARDALLVTAPGGFPCARPGAVAPAAASLPAADASVGCVVDATRPEEPDDQPARLRELVRVCRPGGTVALVACAPATSPPVSACFASRSLTLALAVLAQAGCDPVRLVPFDFLGPFSHWRLGLGERRERVLVELEEHLRFPLVRDAVRLLERQVVAALPPEQAGRVLVVVRRRGALPAADEPAPSLATALAAPGFRAAALRLAQDDAVLRWAAFVDAEIFSAAGGGSAAGAGVNLVRWLSALSATPPAVLRPGRWRWEGHELWRFLEAASHGMAARTIATLAEETAGTDARALVPTLEYDLVHALNRLFDRCLEAIV